MNKVWKTLMIAGYVLMSLFAVNFFYVSILYAIRHEGWFFIYNPTLGSHTNAALLIQIVWSIILMLIAWAIISISKKRLKVAR